MKPILFAFLALVAIALPACISVKHDEPPERTTTVTTTPPSATVERTTTVY